MAKCNCDYEPKPEPVFVRPNDGTVFTVVNPIEADQRDLIYSGSAPATLWALGKTETVDLSVLKRKEKLVEFTSSATIPYIEAEKE